MAEKGEGEPAASAASSLVTATDKLRQSANWLLGAFAAVGAVFAAGLQLANIGSLGADTPGRLTVAALGLSATVIAIIVAVSAAGSVSARSRVNLALLGTGDLAAIQQEIDNDHEALAGFTDIADLRQEVVARRGAVLQKDRAYRSAYTELAAALATADQSRKDKADQVLQQADVELELAKRDLDFAEATKQQVLELATFLRVKSLYDKAKNRIAVAAAAAAVGIALFAWGANPPAAETTVLPTEVLPETPSEVTIRLTDPDEGIQRQLGPECNASENLDAIALDVEGETYQVAIVQTATCDTAWITVGPEQGEVFRRAAPAPR